MTDLWNEFTLPYEKLKDPFGLLGSQYDEIIIFFFKTLTFGMLHFHKDNFPLSCWGSWLFFIELRVIRSFTQFHWYGHTHKWARVYTHTRARISDCSMSRISSFFMVQLGASCRELKNIMKYTFLKYNENSSEYKKFFLHKYWIT